MSAISWDDLENETIFYVIWDVFTKRTSFGDHDELKSQGLLQPFHRKKKILYVSYRDQTENIVEAWNYLAERKESFEDEFDGFYLWHQCEVPIEGPLSENWCALRSFFIRKCYVIVVSDYNVFKDRFWMLWECLQAAKNRRLIINEQAKDLLDVTTTHPTFDTVYRLLSNAKVDCEEEKQQLMGQIERLYFEGATYSLIPIREINEKERWEDIRPVPLAVEHVNPARVLMVSHRWSSVDHPDKKNEKLELIREFCKVSDDKYDFVFFDWRCINQQKSLTASLVKVDKLYAKSHCLCICNEGYFQRSWCLFEICVNKFNRDSQTVVPENTTHPVLDWLETARLVQQMGYIHCLKNRSFEFQTSKEKTMTLSLPTDSLHLKSELRRLFRNSNLTNKGDIRVLLTLLDSLVGTPRSDSVF